MIILDTDANCNAEHGLVGQRVFYILFLTFVITVQYLGVLPAHVYGLMSNPTPPASTERDSCPSCAPTACVGMLFVCIYMLMTHEPACVCADGTVNMI